MRMKKGSFKNVTVAFILGTMTVSVLTPTLSYGEDNISSEKNIEERNETEEILNNSLENQKEADIKSISKNENNTYNAPPVVNENKNGFVYENASWNFYKNGEIYRKRDIVHGVINGISGWYYVNNGKADLSKTSVENNIHGWWYIKNGKVDFSYTGFAKNEHGWWYVENGNVTFKRSEVTYGTVNGQTGWWNVKGSNVKFNESIEPNSHGWWYVKNGKVDFSKTSVEHNSHGWWYVKDGRVDFSYTGVKNNRYGWWYIKNGHVDFSYTGFAKNEHGWWYIEKGNVTFKRSEVTHGIVNGQSGWWNVKGSNVKFNESIEPNRHGWWYVKKGKVDFSYTGVKNNPHGWWYVKNGKVDFSYTGIASNEHGKWYINKGKVDFSANGTRTISGVTYTVKKGEITGVVDPVQSEMASRAQNYNSSTDYMIMVDRSAKKVGIMRGGNKRLDKYWSCCVGAPSTPTITGVYRLGSKGKYFNTGTTGRCWYYSQISGSYLFHSVIYDRQSSPNYIMDGTMGKAVSHGCVRLDVSNAKYIYDYVPSGTTIVIYN